MYFSFESSRSAAKEDGALNVVLFETEEVSPHLETTLELAQKHLDHGDHVTICFWRQSLPYCEPWGGFQSPELTGTAFKRGCARLSEQSGNLKIQTALGISDSDEDLLRRTVNELQSDTLEQLKEQVWLGLDLGMGVVSSLVSRFKDPFLNLQQYEDLVQNAMLTFMLSHQATKRVLDATPYDLAYVFNGRFSAPRGILRALESEGIAYRIHERGCDSAHYCLLTDVPHNRTYVQSCIKDYWTTASENRESKISQAQTFFMERQRGTPRGWLSFTDHQDQPLPQHLRKANNLVSYFCSSDDEYVAIGYALNQRGFTTQAEAVAALMSATESKKDCQLVIRVHPHLRDKPENSRRYWDTLDTHDRCTVIPADSTIRSYDLIAASKLVVTYGSTVGVEANYMNKPSLLLGSSMYDELNVADEAFTPELVCEYISDHARWKPRPQLGSLMYGYYAISKGIPFDYFKPIGFLSGEFKDENLFANPETSPKPVRQRFAKRALHKIKRTLQNIKLAIVPQR